MVLKRLRKLKKRRSMTMVNSLQEEYIEVSMASETKRKKIGIVVEKLTEFSDTDVIVRQVREGKLVFLNIKDLRNKDIEELKRAIEKLKRSVLAQNGDIVGVEQNWLILTPQHAVVHR